MRIKNILLAEDDEDDILFFKEFLAERSDIFLLPPAENGIELLEILQTSQQQGALPDLIILDQNMPKLNGMQTLLRIKQEPTYTGIPIFVYSTYTTDDLVNTCMKNGAALVMMKPTNREGYAKMIEEIFEKVD